MVKHRLYITDIYHLHAEQSSGLPQGQEKLKKMTKVRKKWGFLKKSQEKTGNLSI